MHVYIAKPVRLTEPSYLGLLAEDQSVRLLRGGDDIIQDEVLQEFASMKPTYCGETYTLTIQVTDQLVLYTIREASKKYLMFYFYTTYNNCGSAKSYIFMKTFPGK